MGLYPAALPDFPWDSLAALRAKASSHPDGIVDVSVGTPVDPTPELIRDALIAAADSPGYPTTHGTLALRQAIVDWFARRRGVANLSAEAVLPVLGSKELVAFLPALLGIGPGDTVVFPKVAYPTYEVGARLAGAVALAADDVSDWADTSSVKVVWLNSPSNPTGEVKGVEYLRHVVEAARRLGAVVVSDECYAELPWSPELARDGVISLLDPRVSGGSNDGLLVTYSLSKQSNVAGYRAAFLAGDVNLVSTLLEVRKHAGMIMPGPVQAAMTVALGDDAHVKAQKGVYGARRALLREALEQAGFRIDHSVAGLYLWSTKGQDCWLTLEWLAERGILAAPGSFYGEYGAQHVRIALTATDERIHSAVTRLVKDQ